jgi:hypothetical protein
MKSCEVRGDEGGEAAITFASVGRIGAASMR